MSQYDLDRMDQHFSELCSAMVPESVKIASLIYHAITSWELIYIATLLVAGGVAKAYLRGQKNV